MPNERRAVGWTMGSGHDLSCTVTFELFRHHDGSGNLSKRSSQISAFTVALNQVEID